MDTLTQKTCESFEQVMERYTPMVYRIAFARLGSHELAEDISQDVFLRYYKAKMEFESEEHRKAWLIRCALNCTKTLFGSGWFRHRASDKGLDNMSDEEQTSADTTAEYAERSERRSTVLNAVMSLPEKYRTVIHLFYFEDMSIAQISNATGIKETTVKSQLSRARDMLKPLLKEVEL